MHTIINYDKMLFLHGALTELHIYVFMLLYAVIFLQHCAWKYCLLTSNHICTHRGCTRYHLGFLSYRFVFKMFMVCPVIEKSGLKGSLSTYTH